MIYHLIKQHQVKTGRWIHLLKRFYMVSTLYDQVTVGSRINMVEIICLPYRIVVSDVFAYLEIVSKAVDNLNHQIPQFKFFCVFRRDFEKSYLCP